MHLVHPAADWPCVQPLNQWHNATNFGIPEFGSLKFSEFSNSQNQSIMGETGLLACLSSQSAQFLYDAVVSKRRKSGKHTWATARINKGKKSSFYLLRFAKYGYNSSKQTLLECKGQWPNLPWRGVSELKRANQLSSSVHSEKKQMPLACRVALSPELSQQND